MKPRLDDRTYSDEPPEYGLPEHRERNARIFAACFAAGCIAVAVAVMTR